MQTHPPADLSYDAALAALEWMFELGVTAPVGDAPINAYELPDRLAMPERAPAPEAAPERPARPVPVARVEDSVDVVAVARAAATKAKTLEDLREAIMGYGHCALKQGARNTVFADGNPKARVMLIGEAPGRDEDQQGKPFVGRAGQLLDKMLAAIGLDRASPDPLASVYITNVVPWRPPANREPEPAEIAQMLPFLARHVELIDPDLIVLMGNTACSAALGKRGITRLRGNWTEAFGRPALPMLHPANLFRAPANKRLVWEDLLELRARLNAP
ncbi:DNA polymerase [Rhodobacter aestuarii]|uniref:Type-4 uracil-DNA glycosylase n=1 Tax=Rhodobacter aestuarii TaxID=453582 RepID=A0A1N7KCB4_9RHOB|nr:uracil-DNA glycosylase [Rhodobacter aestuarii]PTV95764.1 DNA polymerase [Rhodobacter aestuarii]SIS59212.1 DNA polymerase [Rhodobacter aestuarii]